MSAAAPDMMTLRLRAESGDARAQITLARTLLRERTNAKNVGEAFRYVMSACAQGEAEAWVLRAVLTAWGLGCARSLDEAHACLAHAAALGHAEAKAQLAVLSAADGAFDAVTWRATPQIEAHCAAPRVFTIRGFAPKPACDWLIAQSRPRLQRAMVMDHAAGALRANEYRTNSEAQFAPLHEDLVLQLVNLRIAAVTGVPIPHHEGTNIFRYAPGEQYKPHYDFIFGPRPELYASDLQRGGQRLGTFLIYLNDGYEGGETDFPQLGWRFKGEAGDALLFWNVSAQGQLEERSLHAGLPVTRGDKWLFSKWLRERPFH